MDSAKVCHTATLDFECPHCHEEYDLLEEDDNEQALRLLSIWWMPYLRRKEEDDLEETIECKHCNQPSVIKPSEIVW